MKLENLADGFRKNVVKIMAKIQGAKNLFRSAKPFRQVNLQLYLQ